MSSQTLASIVEWLDSRISRDPETNRRRFEQLLSSQRELGLLHDERPICPFLRPYILSRSQYERKDKAPERGFGAFQHATSKYD